MPLRPIVVAILCLAAGCASRKQPAAMPPAPAVSGAFTGWTPVPVEFDGVYFYTNFTLNGQGPYRFLIDTGCTRTVIDEGLVEPLGLHPRRARGPAPSTVQGYIDRPALGHAALSFAPEAAMIIAVDEQMSAMVGRRIHGILGADFFDQYIVEQDYERGTMRTAAPAGFSADPADIAVPLVGAGVRWIAATLHPAQGESFGRSLMLDTGFAGGISLDAGVAARMGLPGSAPTITTRSRTLAGESEGMECRLSAVDFGPIRVDAPTVDIDALDPALGDAGPDGISMVGSEILGKFTITFDFPRSRILLRPNASFPDRIEANTTGLGLAARGEQLERLTIIRVHPASPAAAAGFEVDDEVLEVDGAPASGFTPPTLRGYLQERVGRPIVFRISRQGASLDLTLIPRSRI